MTQHTAANRQRIRQSRGDRVFGIVNGAVLALIFIITLYPMLYVLSASFSDPNAVASGKMVLLPVQPSLQAYAYILQYNDIWTGYANTIFYVVVGTVPSIFFSCLGAYTLSRPKLMFKKLFTLLMVFTIYFSGGMIPKFLVVKGVGLYNTRMAVILPGVISTWNMIVMRTSFRAIPQSLE